MSIKVKLPIDPPEAYLDPDADYPVLDQAFYHDEDYGKYIIIIDCPNITNYFGYESDVRDLNLVRDMVEDYGGAFLEDFDDSVTIEDAIGDNKKFNEFLTKVSDMILYSLDR